MKALIPCLFVSAVLVFPADARVHDVRKGPVCAIGSDLLTGIKDADCKTMQTRLVDYENGRIIQGCWFVLLQQYASSLSEEQCSVLDGVWDWVRIPPRP